jgi:hypothetical protein
VPPPPPVLWSGLHKRFSRSTGQNCGSASEAQIGCVAWLTVCIWAQVIEALCSPFISDCPRFGTPVAAQ